MSEIFTQLPALQVVVPLFGALLAALSRRGRTAYVLALIVSWLMPVISSLLLWQALASFTVGF